MGEKKKKDGADKSAHSSCLHLSLLLPLSPGWHTAVTSEENAPEALALQMAGNRYRDSITHRLHLVSRHRWYVPPKSTYICFDFYSEQLFFSLYDFCIINMSYCQFFYPAVYSRIADSLCDL